MTGFTAPTRDEQSVLLAIAALRANGRATNTSAVARNAYMPRTTVRTIIERLAARHLIIDATPRKGAPSWMLTDAGRKYTP